MAKLAEREVIIRRTPEGFFYAFEAGDEDLHEDFDIESILAFVRSLFP